MRTMMAVFALSAALVTGLGPMVAAADNTGAPLPVGSVTTDKKDYGLGASVKITFTVENRSKQDIALRFPTGQHFDIWIVKDGKEVWRSSHGRVFTQAFNTMVLKAGETKTFEDTWQQVDNNGKQVPPGAYDVFASLTDMNTGITPVKTSIRVGTSRSAITQTSLSRIVRNINAIVGRNVSITGTYRGWQPDKTSPACKPGPPVSRSDWAVSDRTGCIFVHGKSSLDPKSDYGKVITVIGIVKKTASGQPYIESTQVTVTK